MDYNDNILEFIRRRFPKDDNWLSGNCYYFALILKDRFGGDIEYDVVNGHFVLKNYNGIRYDHSGVVKEDSIYVKWDDFDSYDDLQKKQIIQDCLE